MKYLFLLVLTVALGAADAQAQRRGSFGIGGQLGDPSGLALKFGSGNNSFDLAAGWDLDDYLFVQGHLLLRERPLPGSGADLTYFYGPGLFVGVSDHRDETFGISFNAGLAYYTGPIEIFGQLTPRLRLIDDTDFDLGAAIGLRFYP